VDEYDRLIGLLEQDTAPPIWERQARGACDAAIDRLQSNPGTRRARRVVAILVMPLSKATAAAESVRLERDAALVGLAVELHRRRTGVYPASLDEVADRFPAGLPPDWIDGRPLRYAVRDGRPTVYSLGPDGDDDGGELPEGGFTGALYSRVPSGVDGDLVMWPRRPLIDAGDAAK
jgi:hypothetical protein